MKYLVFGLIGYPLKHSFSPYIHNAAFKHLKIKAKYQLFPLQENELKGFFANLKKENVRGLNVTIPYKEKVLEILEGRKDKAVEAIGATNTILVDEKGGLNFFNTDYLGFLRHLETLNIRPKKIAIIGAGGASRAICFALGKKKAKEVWLYDIARFRSQELAQRFNYLFPATKFQAVNNISGLRIKDKDLLINASPVGMSSTDPLLVNSRMLHSGLFVYDLIYNPYETKLLKLAREADLGYANGLGMLLYQAVESFDIWFGKKKAPLEIMQKALSKVLEKKIKKERKW